MASHNIVIGVPALLIDNQHAPVTTGGVKIIQSYKKAEVVKLKFKFKSLTELVDATVTKLYELKIIYPPDAKGEQKVDVYLDCKLLKIKERHPALKIDPEDGEETVCAVSTWEYVFEAPL